MAKKSFKDTDIRENPALSYITQPPKQEVPDSDPAPHTTTPGAEPKSKRFNLLLRPSAHESIAMLAKVRQTSVNALIDRVITEYCEAHADEIAKGKDFFGGIK